MSFMDHHQHDAGEQQAGARSLLRHRLIKDTPVEQLSFPVQTSEAEGFLPAQQDQHQYGALPGVTRPLYDPTTSPGVTQSLINPLALANVTRQLGEVETGSLPVGKSVTKALREPMVIRGNGKKSAGSIRPPEGRRLVVHIAVTSFLLLMMLGTLTMVLPTGSNAQGSGFSIFKPIMDIVNTKGNNTASIASLAATATAVTQDGFDPGVNTGQFQGIPTAPPSYGGNGNHFYYGQCTYWAAMRYHELTGKWVPWLGNANQWAAGARSFGWIVSSTPKLHSIIVLQAGVQGSGYYGHVAIVEQVNSDGSVLTSNWNWLGNWGVKTMVVFTPGSGVSFVYAPGN
jgi:surface antigen